MLGQIRLVMGVTLFGLAVVMQMVQFLWKQTNQETLYLKVKRVLAEKRVAAGSNVTQ